MSMPFDERDRKLIQYVCEQMQRFFVDKKEKIKVKYVEEEKPVYMNYKMVAYLDRTYVSDNMVVTDHKILMPGKARIQGREFHYLLNDLTSDIKYKKSEKEFEKAGYTSGKYGYTESHDMRKFSDICIILEEMLNDDDIRKPHAIEKIKEYQRMFETLEKIAKRRDSKEDLWEEVLKKGEVV